MAWFALVMSSWLASFAPSHLDTSCRSIMVAAIYVLQDRVALVLDKTSQFKRFSKDHGLNWLSTNVHLGLDLDA